jgi:hypothetical protein
LSRLAKVVDSNAIDRSQDTGVPECKWWSSAVGTALS